MSGCETVEEEQILFAVDEQVDDWPLRIKPGICVHVQVYPPKGFRVATWREIKETDYHTDDGSTLEITNPMTHPSRTSFTYITITNPHNYPVTINRLQVRGHTFLKNEGLGAGLQSGRRPHTDEAAQPRTVMGKTEEFGDDLGKDGDKAKPEASKRAQQIARDVKYLVKEITGVDLQHDPLEHYKEEDIGRTREKWLKRKVDPNLLATIVEIAANRK